MREISKFCTKIIYDARQNIWFDYHKIYYFLVNFESQLLNQSILKDSWSFIKLIKTIHEIFLLWKIQIAKRSIRVWGITFPNTIGSIKAARCTKACDWLKWQSYFLNSPTRARITVSSGAAGKVMVVLNSNIWRSSTMKTNIWCWEYRNNMVIDTVWKERRKGKWKLQDWHHHHCKRPEKYRGIKAHLL